MTEDRHPKRQFPVKDQRGNLETGAENMTGRLDLNPGLLEMSPELGHHMTAFFNRAI